MRALRSSGSRVETRMRVRDATEADLPGIFAIYDREVLTGTATFDTPPKTAEQRRERFNASPRDRYCVLVAVKESGEEIKEESRHPIIGWARLYPWSPRKAYDRTAELGIYVHHEHRGRGVGRALMTALTQRAREAGVDVLIARVVEGNPASLALHESTGFKTIGVMRRVGEKFGRILDVRLLDLHLDEA